MNKTRKLILETTMSLFNKHGVGSVRLKEIAEKAKISQGNLNYHFKTKKDLLEGDLAYMKQEQEDRRTNRQSYLEEINTVNTIPWYISFHVRFIFFYRDILVLIKLVPSAKAHYEKQMENVHSFAVNSIYLSIGKGEAKPEPHEGYYNSLANSVWAILQSWLMQRAIMGPEKVRVEDATIAILDLYYPHYTEKGKEKYFEYKKQLSKTLPEK